MKKESNPVLMLDSFIALRSKSYLYSYANQNGVSIGILQKAKSKGVVIIRHSKKTTNSVYLILKQNIPQTIQLE